VAGGPVINNENNNYNNNHNINHNHLFSHCVLNHQLLALPRSRASAGAARCNFESTRL